MTVASLDNRAAALPDDATLPQRFAAGDDAAFDTAVVLYSPRLARLTRRLLAWSPDADDALQETFIRAYLARGSFRADAHLLTWLTRIGINACRAQQRRHRLGLHLVQRLLHHKPSAPPALRGSDPLAESVRAAVRRLSAKDRELVVLYYLEEIPASEITGLLAISDSTLHTRLHRARKKLVPLLAPFAPRAHQGDRP